MWICPSASEFAKRQIFFRAMMYGNGRNDDGHR
jgi:hypothetical protein